MVPNRRNVFGHRKKQLYENLGMKVGVAPKKKLQFLEAFLKFILIQIFYLLQPI
jgi:hypothetical protein